MPDEHDEERWEAECLRLVAKLQQLADERHLSIRALEKKMGVGDSVFNKVLKGKITLQFRHVLMICDALGVSWKEFFAGLYGLELEPAPAEPTETEQEKILFLVRVGVLTPKQAAKLLKNLPPAPDLLEQE